MPSYSRSYFCLKLQSLKFHAYVPKKRILDSSWLVGSYVMLLHWIAFFKYTLNWQIKHPPSNLKKSELEHKKGLYNNMFFLSICIGFRVYKYVSCPFEYLLTFSPFSQLNGDWMVAKWRLNGDGRWILFAFQSPFNKHSVDWMASTCQWPFSQ